MNWVVLNWHWKYQCKLMILYIHIYVCYCLVAKFCLTYLRPMDCSSPGSSVHGISQARILEWVAIYFSRDLPNPGIKPALFAGPVSCIGRWILNCQATREAQVYFSSF